ncbi:pyruvate flavodoxin/ferredoxin oxidoreductase domain protein [Denitrovibrio acetiphilus DSM 12809]|uniref:Pyruvate flavodoxin/ferredoxin oxidoreductase domain protein n=1 Tax=Denitrovibrio acetiphilus (strain DSM 12809 / NBRC 114555 / N2460) TaxID=522772 RepID=D4H1J7_DENA2|nr:2-oxoacid:acceptor oxidoreductase subunit alpha [Denitrovibrio acetiphilus]ADD68757.1 pyruvate flavodoxin/ferredoxin oxidoreductase domain protein [Denitrovibrio acetiphilus DSM 12809]
MNKTYAWKVGGPAGFGISSIGPVFANILKKCGYYVHGYLEYPSLIRGGYNSYQMVFSKDPVYAPRKRIDIYLALADVCFEKEHFDDDTVVIGDFENLKKADGAKGNKVDVPLKKLVDDINGKEIMKNTAALGASIAALGLPKDILEEVVRGSYPAKIAEPNVKAALAGFDACDKKIEGVEVSSADVCSKCAVMSGNEAVSIGAIRAGVSFYSTYPMTPASTILHFLAKQARNYGIVVKHTEDEISGINMAVGAAHAGARAMTGTSGGGFALMNEGFGLAAITETPVVVALSQRPGPATGMPTWTEQGDLHYALNASQGEFLRAVYTPGDLREAYEQTFDAFNLAEKYHIPAIILLDKFISESVFMTNEMNPTYGELNRGALFEGNDDEPYAHFPRYEETENGVGTRSIPGTPGGLFIASSNEHDEKGFVSDTSEMRIQQTDRRYKKEPFVADEMPHPFLVGKEDAKLTFVCFGSMKQILLEAIKSEDRFNFIHFPAVNPLNWDKVAELLKGKNLVAFENNKTAQLKALIAKKTGILIEKEFLKYDGRPFFTEEVLEYVKEVL